jgi:hypothetical protein
LSALCIMRLVDFCWKTVLLEYFKTVLWNLLQGGNVEM